MMKNYLKKIAAPALAFGFLFVFSCGGGLGGPGANEPVKTGIVKYDTFFERADKLEADIKAAKESIKKAQADLAVAVGLDAKASLGDIKTAIREAIDSAVIKAGGHVEVKIEGGVFASGAASVSDEGAGAGGAVGGSITVTIEIVGDVEASADVHKIIDAAKVALQASAEIATELKPITLEIPDLLSEAADLSASITADIKDPILAAKVTARLTGLTGIFKEVTGLYDTSFDFTVEVQASFSVEASAEAEASAEGEASAGTE